MKYDPTTTAATAVANTSRRLRPPTLLDVAEPSFDADPERWQPRNAGAVVHNGIRKSELRGFRYEHDD